MLLAAQKVSMAELKINTLVNSQKDKAKEIEMVKRSDPESESSGIPLRIKSALKADKINFFEKLEKCSKMGKIKAKIVLYCIVIYSRPLVCGAYSRCFYS